MSNNNNASSLVWFLTGAAAGAAIALLYAPQSGRQSRKFIQRKTEGGQEALADIGKDVLDRGREYYDKGRKIAEEAGELFERGRKKQAL
jgi:gas vesicle protein